MNVENYDRAAELLYSHKDDEFIELFDKKRLGFDIFGNKFGDCMTAHANYTLFEMGCLSESWKAVFHMLQYVEKIHIDAVILTYGKGDADIGEKILDHFLMQNGGRFPENAPENFGYKMTTIEYFVCHECSLELFKKAIELGQRIKVNFLLSVEGHWTFGFWRPDLAEYLVKNHSQSIDLESDIETIVVNWSKKFAQLCEELLESTKKNQHKILRLVYSMFTKCQKKLEQINMSEMFRKACNTLQNGRDNARLVYLCFFFGKMALMYGKPQVEYGCNIPCELQEIFDKIVTNCQTDIECKDCKGTRKRKAIDLEKANAVQQDYKKFLFRRIK